MNVYSQLASIKSLASISDYEIKYRPSTNRANDDHPPSARGDVQHHMCEAKDDEHQQQLIISSQCTHKSEPDDHGIQSNDKPEGASIGGLFPHNIS
jgi:hypothetical protein